MLATKQNFKSSVNIKFDLKNIDFLKRYLPTPSHAEALQGILSGYNISSNRRAHIIIGPYGTGKSMLGTLLASIVSKNINKKDFNYISNKFNSLDDGIYTELLQIRDREKRYLPVILNGYEGKFKHSVLSSIQKTLTSNGFNIIVPGVVSKIIETVDNWKENYPKTYNHFKRLLKEENKDIDVWRLEVLAQNSNEIDWFKSIFPSLTSGAEFLVDLGEDFIEQIKYVLDELGKCGVGLFIVYDEFGRYLQSLDHNEVNETMQNLQDLAELVDHYSDDLHLLLITHKHLRHYFSSFNEEFQNEFQRIEKRFRLYYIDSDSSTFFRIAESVISTMVTEKPDMNQIKEMTNRIRKYPLFQQLNQVEIENLIVKGTFPIHPVALYILPYLSSQYGQNERTLFTFLESRESYSLQEHISTDESYYLPYQLFSYFFPNFFDVDFGEKDKIASIYKTIIRKIPDISTKRDNNNYLLSMIQFITLWELCGLQSKVKLSSEFIAFAFNRDLSDIEKELSVLESLKSIRFNRILGYWELFEGSGYNIDELVEENSKTVDTSKGKNLAVLEESLLKKYYLPREYNDHKSMTRFASINLVFSSDILNETFNPDTILNLKSADAIINLIIMETKEGKEDLIEKIKSFSNPLSLYYIHPYPLNEVEHSILKKYTLNQIIQNEDITSNDKNLKKELQVHLEDVTYELNKFMQVFYDFSSEATWLIRNQQLPVKNEIILEEYLSQLMYEYFPLTPEIRNDSYNRRKVNSVQLKAGHKIVNHIIKTPYNDRLGIEGNGPDYLIYAAIFKINQFNIKDLENIQSKEFKRLRIALLKKLEQQPSGNFVDLVNVFSATPFGIRKPNIPILLISLLRDKWDQMLFYNNEMFISQMNGEILFSMVDEPEKYQYNFLSLSNEFNQFISFLEDVFKEYINTENEQTIKPVRVTTAMIKWLRTLPRFVQITRSVNEELVLFKDNIRVTEIDPEKGLKLIYDQFKDNLEKIKMYVFELNRSFEYFRKEIISELYSIVQVDMYVALKDWTEKQNPALKKQNNLVKSINTHIDSEAWIEKVAYDLVGVELTNWSDKTKEMFLVQVQSEYQKLNKQDTSFDDSITINYKDRTKSIRKAKLSTKSQTLYRNVARILKNGGRNVPKEEIENIVLHLLEDFVE